MVTLAALHHQNDQMLGNSVASRILDLAELFVGICDHNPGLRDMTEWSLQYNCVLGHETPVFLPCNNAAVVPRWPGMPAITVAPQSALPVTLTDLVAGALTSPMPWTCPVCDTVCESGVLLRDSTLASWPVVLMIQIARTQPDGNINTTPVCLHSPNH